MSRIRGPMRGHDDFGSRKSPSAIQWDAVAVLTVGMVLTCAVPSYLSITKLGSVGRPALLWFLGALLWWGWTQLQRPFPQIMRTQPARLFLFLFLGVISFSYALCNLRGLSPDEGRAADSGLLRALSWAGLFLIANDGIVDRERLLATIRVVPLLGASLAALGLVQFVSGHSLVSEIELPGFSASSEVEVLRSGFLRAAATATHPLEYGLALCMALPIGIMLALSESRGRRVFHWLCVSLIASASALSVSRSTIIGLIAGLIVLIPAWPRVVRLRALAVCAVAILIMYIAVPGMVGTIRGMFITIPTDSSTQSRTDSYNAGFDMAARSPLFGKGFGTFLPKYRILDNEYLLLLMDVGIVGLLAFVLLMFSGIFCCLRTRGLRTDPLMLQLSTAVAGSLVAGAVLFCFFDALSFPIASAFFFLILGIAGAMWRIARDEVVSPGVIWLPSRRTRTIHSAR